MEHCHTTSLPLVAAYNGNGFNGYNGYNNCNDFSQDYGLYSAINCTHDAVTAGNTQQNTDAHSIRHGISMNASESRISEKLSSNNTDAFIRSEGNRVNDNVTAQNLEIRGKLDLNTRDIFNVEKSVFKENCETRELVAKSTSDILLEGAKNTAAITLDAAKNFSAITLQQCEDKAQILAAIAECCCEQKALTIKEAADTRQLINGNTIASLQTQLSEAKLLAAIADIRGNGQGNNK
jgi:hypothetical protein